MAIRFKKTKKWFHVGNMTKKVKKSSFEGSGLSISQHPKEWSRIARLSGDLYTVHKENPLLLDFHKLSKRDKTNIFEWGVERGYLVKGFKWVFTYIDEDDEMYREFLSYEDWLMDRGYDEEDAEDQEDLNEDKESLEKVKAFLGTTKLFEAECWDREHSPSMAETFCILRYADEMLGVDGVFWNDILDVYRYSAPRAVIFQSKLPEWTIQLVEEPTMSR